MTTAHDDQGGHFQTILATRVVKLRLAWLLDEHDKQAWSYTSWGHLHCEPNTHTPLDCAAPFSCLATIASPAQDMWQTWSAAMAADFASMANCGHFQKPVKMLSKHAGAEHVYLNRISLTDNCVLTTCTAIRNNGAQPLF